MTLLCIFTSAEQLRYRNINGLLATFECEFICRISFKYNWSSYIYSFWHFVLCGGSHRYIMIDNFQVNVK